MNPMKSLSIAIPIIFNNHPAEKISLNIVRNLVTSTVIISYPICKCRLLICIENVEHREIFTAGRFNPSPALRGPLQRIFEKRAIKKLVKINLSPMFLQSLAFLKGFSVRVGMIRILAICLFFVPPGARSVNALSAQNVLERERAMKPIFPFHTRYSMQS